LIDDALSIAVATPDAPLLQVGPLDFAPRKLMGHPDLLAELPRLYSWAMTNYWETNFEASLGGFHEFRYHIAWHDGRIEPEIGIRNCRSMNLGFRTFRVGA